MENFKQGEEKVNEKCDLMSWSESETKGTCGSHRPGDVEVKVVGGINGHVQILVGLQSEKKKKKMEINIIKTDLKGLWETCVWLEPCCLFCLAELEDVPAQVRPWSWWQCSDYHLPGWDWRWTGSRLGGCLFGTTEGKEKKIKNKTRRLFLYFRFNNTLYTKKGRWIESNCAARGDLRHFR